MASARVWTILPLFGFLLGAGCGRPAQVPSDHPGLFRVQAAALDPIPEDIGRLVPDFEFVDVDGVAGRLSDYSNHTALVIALRDTDCPVSRRYGQTLARIEAACATQNIAFLYLNCATPNTLESIQQERRQFGFRGRYVHDPKGELGRALGVRTTAEVFLLDRARTLNYRGALDDQFGIGHNRAQPQQQFLEDALTALRDRTPIEIKATSAPGCALNLGPRTETVAAHVTYYNQISRIVEERCVRCHHTGGAGPFPLTSLEDVASRREMIKLVLESDYMPPWSATPGTGPWANDPSLTALEKEQILTWIEAEAPAGDSKDAPVLQEFPGGWGIGEPDYIVELPEPVELPAEGMMPYYNRVIELPFKEDVWIQAIQILPTSVQHVHHSLAMLESDAPPPLMKRIRHLFRRFLPRTIAPFEAYIALYVPGSFGRHYFPENTAALIPAGSRLKIQIHYVTTGVPATDRTRVGFVMAKHRPEFEARMSTASVLDFVIPAGAPNHKIQGDYEFPQTGKLMSLTPHMHYRGKAFQFELIDDAGASTNLLSVPAYDFNWQHEYVLHRPIDVQPGMRLRATGWFDNSAKNPANPDPTSDVRYGMQSTNEMMTGCFMWITPVNSK